MKYKLFFHALGCFYKHINHIHQFVFQKRFGQNFLIDTHVLEKIIRAANITKEDAKNEGVLLSEIGYIKSSIDRIEKNLDKLEERYSNLSNKIVKVEESVANAHKRITEHINDILKHGGHNQ